MRVFALLVKEIACTFSAMYALANGVSMVAAVAANLFGSLLAVGSAGVL